MDPPTLSRHATPLPTYSIRILFLAQVISETKVFYENDNFFQIQFGLNF